MTLELGKGMLLALHLGALKDAGQLRPHQVSLGKLNNEGTSEVHQLVIGQQVTGHAAFR